MTNRKHTVKGTLIKFNTVTCDGWMVTPEAFKDCDNTYIPVYKDPIYKEIPEAIGFARLCVTDTGVDYTAVLWDNEDTPDIFDLITLYNNKLCLYANQIEKTDNVITHGKICGSFLNCVNDQAAYIREIDGVEKKPKYAITTVPMCYADMITILEDIRKNETIKNEERLSGLDRVISDLKFECDLENHLY